MLVHKRRKLLGRRVPAGCITAPAYGQTRPLASKETAGGRQKNWRLEINIQKPPPAAAGT
jgi:outer membrane protein OmpA-like peptidoglycan-associated protein